MSVCTSCFNAGIYIANCNDGLTFGTLPDANTDYVVYMQHNGTGRLLSFEVTSDADSMVLIEPTQLDPLQGYTIWVTEDAPNSPRVTITIDATEFTCIDFSVVRTDDSFGVISLVE